MRIREKYDAFKGIYGAPKITQELRQEGEHISERTVGLYMRQMGLRAIWVKHWTVTTKDSDFSHKLRNYLGEHFNINLRQRFPYESAQNTEGHL